MEKKLDEIINDLDFLKEEDKLFLKKKTNDNVIIWQKIKCSKSKDLLINELDNIKNELKKDCFDIEYKQTFETILNLIKSNSNHNLKNHKKHKNIKKYSCEIEKEEKSVFSIINLDEEKLIFSVLEYDLTNYISPIKFSDFEYFQDINLLESKAKIFKDLSYESLKEILEYEDFSLLNMRFLNEINENNYSKANFIKGQINSYFKIINKQLKANFSKDVYNYNKKCFKKNLKFFKEKFKNMKKAKNSERFEITDLDLESQIKFYLMKSLIIFSLNLSKTIESNEYLIELSKLFIILKSPIYLKLMENNKKFDILFKLKNLYFQNYENNFNLYSEKSIKLENKELEKIIMKLETYYLLFGEYSEAKFFLMENEKYFSDENSLLPIKISA